MSQARLKGRPKSMGSIRSHSETEKHMAPNGISARKSAPIEGGFKTPELRQNTCRGGGDGFDDEAISARNEQACGRSWVSVAFCSLTGR
jgi:hypothetical protein